MLLAQESLEVLSPRERLPRDESSGDGKQLVHCGRPAGMRAANDLGYLGSHVGLEGDLSRACAKRLE